MLLYYFCDSSWNITTISYKYNILATNLEYMGTLIIVICLNILLLVIFRMFKKYEVDSFQAIVINYLTCVAVGSFVLGRFPLDASTIDKPWFPYSIALGFLFITGFNLLAQSVQHFGVTLTSIAQKMSLLLSVGFAVVLFNETVNIGKGIGLLAALASIVLINLPDQSKAERTNTSGPWYLLIVTWLLSGLIDMTLFYVEVKDLSSNADIGFVVALFGMAAIIGTCIMTFLLITKKKHFAWKNILAGIILGIPNFFTIYLLLVLFNQGFEGSTIFPIVNVAIILGSAILGFSIFKERLSKIQWLGFALGVLCIILIAAQS